jgi:hypothetical protein
MALTRKEIARRRELGAARAALRHIIGAEMMLRGYNGSRLARDIGCSNALVSSVLTGHKHSLLVLDGLRGIGVPEKYLYDPRREAVPGLESRG